MPTAQPTPDAVSDPPSRSEQDERDHDPLFRELAGQVLREHRRAAGLRLVDVARRAGVSPQYISEVERGLKDPSSEILEAIGGAVGLGLDELLTEALRHRGVVPGVGRPAEVVPFPGRVGGSTPPTPRHTMDPLCLAA